MPKTAHKYQVTNVRTKFYGKDEHKTLKGHTVHMDIAYINDKQEIVQEHIILKWTDLVKAGISKLEYLKSL